MNQLNINSGYTKALALAKSHYENFPVVSVFIPKELRKHVAVIYWFARTADDFADDETIPAEQRMQLLISFEERLKNTLANNPAEDLDAALYNTITEKDLNPDYFLALLSAFKQDVIKTRYNRFSEVLDYCSRSANPVGRLLLELFGLHHPETVKYSDKICTALQLANFWQDVSFDIKKDRIYIPFDYMDKFAVTEDDIFKFEKTSIGSRKLKNCVKELVLLTDGMFSEGEKLIPFLEGLFKYEILWTVLGGRKVLDKIKKIDYNVVRERVSLSKTDLLQLGIESIFYGKRKR